MKQKRSARMHTRAKQKHVASDRARCPDVPRRILFTAAKHMFGFEYFVKLMVML